MEVGESIPVKYEKFMPNKLETIRVTSQVQLHTEVELVTARDGKLLTRRGKRLHKAELANWTTIGVI